MKPVFIDRHAGNEGVEQVSECIRQHMKISGARTPPCVTPTSILKGSERRIRWPQGVLRSLALACWWTGRGGYEVLLVDCFGLGLLVKYVSYHP